MKNNGRDSANFQILKTSDNNNKTQILLRSEISGNCCLQISMNVIATVGRFVPIRQIVSTQKVPTSAAVVKASVPSKIHQTVWVSSSYKI